MYVWLYNRGKRKGETLELYGTPLSQIPIVLPTGEDDNMLTELVDDIIARRTSNPNADISAKEAEINRIVYTLYGLTEDEIKNIENTSK